jgi:hypothetical protein
MLTQSRKDAITAQVVGWVPPCCAGHAPSLAGAVLRPGPPGGRQAVSVQAMVARRSGQGGADLKAGQPG